MTPTSAAKARRTAALAFTTWALSSFAGSGQPNEHSLAVTEPPLVVYVHGGGWVTGSPLSGRQLQRYFEADGYAFKGAVYEPEQDVDMLRMVDKVSAEIRQDNRRPVVVVAHSVGAQLAAAAIARDSQSLHVSCLILLDGVGYDLVALVKKYRGLRLRLKLDPDQARQFSPAQLVSKGTGFPNTLLVAGPDIRDTWGQAQDFAGRLRANGIVTVAQYLPEMSHSVFLHPYDERAKGFEHLMQGFLADHDGCHP